MFIDTTINSMHCTIQTQHSQVSKMASTSELEQYSSQELVEAQAHLMNQTFSFMATMSLKCAVQLGIPDIIHKHGKPMTLYELTKALPINESKSYCISRLMRLLIHTNIFTKIKLFDTETDEEEAYWLSPSSRLLLTNGPFSAVAYVLGTLDTSMIDPLHHVSEWLQNDIPTAFETTHGQQFWEHVGQVPKMNVFFNEAMASDAQLVAKVLVKDCGRVFEGLNSIIDVGGGTGALSRAMSGVIPGLNWSVLDLPHVVSGLESNDSNISFIPGNMFELIPQADAVLMKWILHDWSDDDCMKILRKCKDAISSKGKGGKVIIVDIVIDQEKDNDSVQRTQLFFDVLMMSYVNGKERTEKEWAKLFLDAGFATYNITPVLGLRSIIEVFP